MPLTGAPTRQKVVRPSTGWFIQNGQHTGSVNQKSPVQVAGVYFLRHFPNVLLTSKSKSAIATSSLSQSDPACTCVNHVCVCNCLTWGTLHRILQIQIFPCNSVAQRDFTEWNSGTKSVNLAVRCPPWSERPLVWMIKVNEISFYTKIKKRFDFFL